MKEIAFTLFLICLAILTGCSASGAGPLADASVQVCELTPTLNPGPLHLEAAGQVVLEEEMLQPAHLFPLDRSDGFLLMALPPGEKTFLWQERGADLSLRWSRTIPMGQGPLEMINPVPLGGSSTSLYVLEKTTGEVYLWRSRLQQREVIGKIRVGYCVDYRVVFDTGRSVVWMLCEGESQAKGLDQFVVRMRLGTAGILEERIVLRRCWQERDDKGVLYGAPLHLVRYGEQICLLDAQAREISVFNQDGVHLKVLRLQGLPRNTFGSQIQKEWLVRNKQKADYWVYPELWPAAWLLPLGDYLAVGLRENYDPWDERLWVDGALIGSDFQDYGLTRIPGFYGWNDPSCTNWAQTRLLPLGKNALISSGSETGPDGQERFVLKKWRMVP